MWWTLYLDGTNNSLFPDKALFSGAAFEAVQCLCRSGQRRRCCCCLRRYCHSGRGDAPSAASFHCLLSLVAFLCLLSTSIFPALSPTSVFVFVSLHPSPVSSPHIQRLPSVHLPTHTLAPLLFCFVLFSFVFVLKPQLLLLCDRTSSDHRVEQIDAAVRRACRRSLLTGS